MPQYRKLSKLVAKNHKRVKSDNEGVQVKELIYRIKLVMKLGSGNDSWVWVFIGKLLSGYPRVLL